MATYKVNSIFSTDITVGLDFSHQCFGLPPSQISMMTNDDTIPWTVSLAQQGIEAYQQGKHNFIARFKWDFYCRESIVYILRETYTTFYHAFVSKGGYVTLAFAVDIILEPEESSYRSACEKALEVFDKYQLHKVNYNLYRISSNMYRLVFIVKPGSQYRETYMASSLLYLLRHPEILQAALDHGIPPNTYSGTLPTRFWSFLSSEFLKNPSWGDDYNSNMGLAIFFRAFQNGNGCWAVANGPSNFGENASAEILIDFFQNVFLPTLPTVQSLSQTDLRIGSETALSTFRFFLKALNP